VTAVSELISLLSCGEARVDTLAILVCWTIDIIRFGRTCIWDIFYMGTKWSSLIWKNIAY